MYFDAQIRRMSTTAQQAMIKVVSIIASSDMLDTKKIIMLELIKAVKLNTNSITVMVIGADLT